MVTITGYGGTGKTRFSIDLFHRLAADHPGGAGLGSMASVTDPAEVLPTVGIALDVAEAHGRPENAVAIAAAADARSKRAGVVVDHPMDPGIVDRIEAHKAGIPKGTLDGLVEEAKALSVEDLLKMVGE